MSKLITIVVPTYNMEKYLDRCLTSLLVPSELMELLEVLVINDGSKDTSSEIAHRYEKQYPEAFRVIDKENGNYGSCINRALKEATGKYIKVLDADDFFVTDNWKVFLDQLQHIDADLILTDFCFVSENHNHKTYRSFEITPQIKQAVSDVIGLISGMEMHTITYRRQLLLEMNYHQTEGISYTDAEWATLPIINVSSVYYVPLCIYNYFVGRDGQTMDPKIFFSRRMDVFHVYTRILEFCADNNLLQSSISSFYIKRLKNYYLQLYAQSLIYRKFPSADLVAIDINIKNKAIEIYEEMSLSTFSKICYINIWRRNEYKMPFLVAIKIYLICLKRTYFPWLRVGRINLKHTHCKALF